LEEENLIAMKYLKNVKNGDKRIVVVNGKILGGILRKPQPDSWLCNTDKGGLPVISNITPEEEKICVIVNKDLAEKGQVIYGIDTLEDDDGTRILSEINTVNAGGLHELYEVDENLYQTVVQSIYDYIIARFKLQSEVML
jgi:glutathione synthase